MRILKYAIQNIIRNPFLSISSILIVTLLIFFVNILFIILLASERFITSINNRISFTINFQSGYTLDDIDVKLFIDDLRSSFSGITIQTIDKQQAFALLKSRNPDLANLVENTGENPLPDSIRIDDISLDLYDDINMRIEDKKNMFNYDKDVMNRKFLDYKSQFDRISQIVKFLRTLEYGIYTLIILFLFTLAVILYGIVGNSVFFHKEEIQIIGLVGGKKSFIYGPFLLQALISIILSVVMVFLIFFFIISSISFDFMDGQFSQIFSYIHSIWKVFFLTEIGFFSLLGLLSAYIAVGKYAKF